MDESKSTIPSQPEDEQIRGRAIRLFTFLRELTELRSSTVRSLDQYERVLWFSDIPREQGCHCIGWGSIEENERAEVWLEIKKPRLKKPPKLPDELMPWLEPQEVEDSSGDFPKLRERITETRPSAPSEVGSDESPTVFKQLINQLTISFLAIG